MGWPAGKLAESARLQAAYTSIFQPEGDRLPEAEDQCFGRLQGVAYAEVFRSASPILLADPTVIQPALHG